MPEFYQRLSEVDQFVNSTPEEKLNYGDIYADKLIASDKRFQESPEFGDVLRKRIREDIQSELPEVEPPKVGFGPEFQPRLAGLVGEGVAGDVTEVVSGIKSDIDAISSRGFKENFGALGQNSANVLLHTVGIPGRLIAGMAQLPHAAASKLLETAGLGDSTANQWVKAQYAGLEKSKEHMTVFHNFMTEFEPGVLAAGLTGAGAGSVIHKFTMGALNKASAVTAAPGFTATDAAIVSGWTGAAGEAVVVAPSLRVSEHYISESGYTEETKNVLRATMPILVGVLSGVSFESKLDSLLGNPLAVDKVVKGVAKGLDPVELGEEVRRVVKAPDVLDTITKNTNGRVPLESTTTYGENFNIGAGFRHDVEIPGVKFGPETKPEIIQPIAPKVVGNFHGTGSPIKELDDAHFSPTNYYGSGLYTTDSLKVAQGYSESLRTGKTPIVYNTEENQFVKVFNLEEKLSPEIRTILKRAKSDYVDDALDEPLITNTREVYDFIRDESASSGRSVYDVQEDFFAIQQQLEANGYGAMTHIGGLQTKTAPHTVTIYFKPSETVKIKPMTKAEMLKSDAIDASDSQNFIADLVAKSGNVTEEQVAKQNYMDAIDIAYRNQDLSLDDARRATALGDDLSKGWLFGAEQSKVLKELDDLGINGQENRGLGNWTAAHLANEEGYVTPEFMRTIALHSLPLLTGMETKDGELHWNTNKYLKYGAVWNALGFGGLAYRRLGGGKIARGVGSKVSKKFWEGVDHPIFRGAGKPLHTLRPTEGLEKEIFATKAAFKTKKQQIRRGLDEFAIGLKKNYNDEELELISDFIEKEGNNWEAVPKLLQEQASEIQNFLAKTREQLVDSGVDEELVNRLGDTYLHRVYLPQLMKKPTYNLVKSKLKAIQGHYLKRRGKNATLNKRVEEMGLTIEDFQKGDKVYSALTPDAKKTWIHEAQVDRLTEAKKLGPVREWQVVETGKKLIVNTDYNKAEREAMGESRDVALRLAVFFRETSHDIALGQMFKGIDANPAWVLKNTEKLSQKNFSKLAREKGFVKIPDKYTQSGMAKYGKLNNQWVHPDIERVMRTMTKKRYDAEWKETLATIHSKALTTWKISKTAYNPSTHALNTITNFHIAAMDGRNPITTAASGIQTLATKDKYFQMAVEVGLKDSGVLAGEWNLKQFNAATRAMRPTEENMPLAAKAMFGAYGTIKKGVKAPMVMYQWEDEVFKLGVFKDEIIKGATPEEAMAAANKLFFDYSDVPSGVATLRDYGVVPFISWTYKIIPVIAKTAVDHPERLLAMMYMYKAGSDLAYEIQYGDKADAQMKLEREVQPEYQQKKLFGVGPNAQLRLSNDQKTGEARSLDISRYIPGADLFSDFGNSFPFGLHPAMSLAIGYKFNVHPTFKGQQIRPFPEPKNSFQESENFHAWNKFVTNTLLPNIPFLPYTYSSKRVGNALVASGDINENSGWLWDWAQRQGWTGKDYFGNDLDLSDELLSSIGIKINRMDVNQAVAQKLRRQKSAFGTAKRDLSRELGGRKSTPARTERALQGYAEQVEGNAAKMERLSRLIGEAR